MSKEYSSSDLQRFENDLYTKLEAGRPGWSWEWLNKPISIWLLTSIAAGLIGYLYTNYSSCRASQNADNELLSRLAYELNGRRTIIDNAWLRSEGDAEKKRTYVAERLNVDRYYVFVELKNQSTEALGHEAQRILEKWSIWNESILSEEETDKNRVDKTRVVAAGMNTIKEFERLAHMFTMKEGAEASLNDWIFRTLNSARTAGVRLRKLVEKPVIGPSACTSRAFWPF